MVNSRRQRAAVSADDAAPAISLTAHARRRGAQRNLAPDAVDYIVAHGRMIHRTGAVFYALTKRDIPYEDRRFPWAARLAGAVVLASRDGDVITLYRNGLAIRAISRKLKYRLPWKTVLRHSSQPHDEGRLHVELCESAGRDDVDDLDDLDDVYRRESRCA